MEKFKLKREQMLKKFNKFNIPSSKIGSKITIKMKKGEDIRFLKEVVLPIWIKQGT